jgi:hypothetical protein
MRKPNGRSEDEGDFRVGKGIDINAATREHAVHIKSK